MLDITHLFSHDRVCRHELGHACGMLAQGVCPESIDVSGQGPYRGLVTVGPDRHVIRTPAEAAFEARHVIAAWLCEGAAIPEWPLNSGAIASRDERNLGGMGEVFGWNEDDWARLVAEAKNLVNTPTFNRAYNALGAALQHKFVVGKDEMLPLVARSARPRAERRNFPTRWLQTKSVTHNDAGARALARVQEILNREQDIRAARYAAEGV